MSYSLGLDLAELVELVGHLVDGLLLLLAQTGNGGLILHLLLLHITANLLQLILTLLVQLKLWGEG